MSIRDQKMTTNQIDVSIFDSDSKRLLTKEVIYNRFIDHLTTTPSQSDDIIEIVIKKALILVDKNQNYRKCSCYVAIGDGALKTPEVMPLNGSDPIEFRWNFRADLEPTETVKLTVYKHEINMEKDDVKDTFLLGDVIVECQQSAGPQNETLHNIADSNGETKGQLLVAIDKKFKVRSDNACDVNFDDIFNKKVYQLDTIHETLKSRLAKVIDSDNHNDDVDDDFDTPNEDESDS